MWSFSRPVEQKKPETTDSVQQMWPLLDLPGNVKNILVLFSIRVSFMVTDKCLFAVCGDVGTKVVQNIYFCQQGAGNISTFGSNIPSYPQTIQQQEHLPTCVLFINFFDKESSDIGGTTGQPPRGSAPSMGTFDPSYKSATLENIGAWMGTLLIHSFTRNAVLTTPQLIFIWTETLCVVNDRKYQGAEGKGRKHIMRRFPGNHNIACGMFTDWHIQPW